MTEKSIEAKWCEWIRSLGRDRSIIYDMLCHALDAHPIRESDTMVDRAHRAAVTRLIEEYRPAHLTNAL